MDMPLVVQRCLVLNGICPVLKEIIVYEPMSLPGSSIAHTGPLSELVVVVHMS